MSNSAGISLQKNANDAEVHQLLGEELIGDFVFYRPNEKQKKFHELGTKAHQRLFLGGNRSGKTYAACMEIAFHLTGIYPPWWKGYRYDRPVTVVCASVTELNTRDNLQKKFFEWDYEDGTPPILSPSMVVSTISAGKGCLDKAYICHVSGMESELRFMAYRQGPSVFQGWKADFIHLDEMPPFDVYQEALVRTTSFSGDPTFMVVTSWPEGGMSDTLGHFWNNAEEEEVKKDRVYVRISWDDTTHMSEAKKKALEDSIPPYIRNARKFGIPIFGHGQVFTMLEEEITVEPFEIPSYWSQVYGLDPSSTSGGTWGMVLLAYDRDSKIVYAAKDYERSDVTPMEHGYNIKQLVPDWCIGMNDPAGAGENMHTKEKTIDFLKNTCKLKLVNAYKANGTKEATIDEIFTLCRSGKFKIMYASQKKNEDGTVTPERGCRHLMHEWRQYARDDKGNIIKKNDHTIDALLYALGGLRYAKTEGRSYMEHFYNNPYGKSRQRVGMM